MTFSLLNPYSSLSCIEESIGNAKFVRSRCLLKPWRKRLSQHEMVERNLRVLLAEGSMDAGQQNHNRCPRPIPLPMKLAYPNWSYNRITVKYLPLNKHIL